MANRLGEPLHRHPRTATSRINPSTQPNGRNPGTKKWNISGSEADHRVLPKNPKINKIQDSPQTQPRSVDTGLANLSSTLPAMDAIRFQVLSFMLASRRERVCDGLTIVVRPAQYEALDHAVLHDFLKSLES
jgi:hypothetical protein